MTWTWKLCLTVLKERGKRSTSVDCRTRSGKYQEAGWKGKGKSSAYVGTKVFLNRFLRKSVEKVPESDDDWSSTKASRLSLGKVDELSAVSNRCGMHHDVQPGPCCSREVGRLQVSQNISSEMWSDSCRPVDISIAFSGKPSFFGRMVSPEDAFEPRCLRPRALVTSPDVTRVQS